MAYVTYEEFKAQIQFDDTDLSHRLEIENLLDSVSEALDRQTKRSGSFVADTTASARLYDGKGEPWHYIHECTAVTKVEVKDSVTDDAYDEWDPGDYIACRGSHTRPTFSVTPYTLLLIDPTGGEAIFTSGAYGQMQAPTVRVTANWGYAAACPPTIQTAAIMLAVRWYKRLQTAMSQSVGKAKSGKLTYNIETMDPDIWTLLVAGHFVRRAQRFGGYYG